MPICPRCKQLILSNAHTCPLEALMTDDRARDLTVHLELKIDVNAADWLLAYGTGDTERELRADIQAHLEATVAEVVADRLVAQANGATMADVRITRTYVQPRVLVQEALAALDLGRLPDYPFLRAWGHFMGSLQPYINEQVREARKTGAPQTAIYHRDDHPTHGGWHTFEEILNPSAIESIRATLEHMQA